MTTDIDIVFSINVHEKVNFLIRQLENIKCFVQSKYVVVINTNDTMFNILKNDEYIRNTYNVRIYPSYLNKRRYHGSLTKGIYQNMIYATTHFTFKYFIVLSSRNMFYTELNPKKYKHFIERKTPVRIHQINKTSWHWPSFLKTLLSQYIIMNNKLFSSCAHEGLTFEYHACKSILSFLIEHENIRENIFNWKHCVEEFALQSICVNTDHTYYNIGNGCETNHEDDHLKENTFVYKTIRI
jgi:hypothetical protein